MPIYIIYAFYLNKTLFFDLLVQNGVQESLESIKKRRIKSLYNGLNKTLKKKIIPVTQMRPKKLPEFTKKRKKVSICYVYTFYLKTKKSFF